MKENPFFITLHGIDGTGKTTTAGFLTQGLNNQNMKAINYDDYEKINVDNPFSAAKKRVVKEASPEAQLAFFLGSTLFHSDVIGGLLQQGYSVVKSRYIDDVLAHHAQLGVKNTEEIAALFPIIQPGLRVILTLDETTRRERIRIRGEVDEKDKEIRTLGSRLDSFENYLIANSENLQVLGKAIRIDTAALDPQQVSQIILDHIFTTDISRRDCYHD